MLVIIELLTVRFATDDIESVVNLLRRFYWVSYITNAVGAWTEVSSL
ncbi:MAG: hypothetical protein H7336_11515 [Bacteriovorax sp.]|nr:hypothetical protein [Bacteriovorax sp.]